MSLNKVANIDISMFKNLNSHIFCLDMQLKNLYTNDNATEFFQLANAKDIVGLNHFEIMQLTNVYADCGKFINDDLEVLATATPKLDILEPPIISQNGSVDFFRTNLFPLLDKDSNVLGLLGVSSCITTDIKQEYNNLISARLEYDHCYKLLTKREKQVLIEVVKGGSYKLIAKKLEVSHRTVESHIENIKYKLGVYSREEIINSVL